MQAILRVGPDLAVHPLQIVDPVQLASILATTKGLPNRTGPSGQVHGYCSRHLKAGTIKLKQGCRAVRGPQSAIVVVGPSSQPSCLSATAKPRAIAEPRIAQAKPLLPKQLQLCLCVVTLTGPTPATPARASLCVTAPFSIFTAACGPPVHPCALESWPVLLKVQTLRECCGIMRVAGKDDAVHCGQRRRWRRDQRVPWPAGVGVPPALQRDVLAAFDFEIFVRCVCRRACATSSPSSSCWMDGGRIPKTKAVRTSRQTTGGHTPGRYPACDLSLSLPPRSWVNISLKHIAW